MKNSPLPRVKTNLGARPHRGAGRFLVIAIFALVTLAPAAADPTSASAVLRIGCLRTDPEARLGPGALFGLRDYLVSATLSSQPMRERGVTDIAVISSDSHEDLVQRMGQNEFDLVFCSASDFVSQRGDYEVLYQFRRPRDSYDPRGQRVFHKGVIFAGVSSPLFPGPDPTSLLTQFLSREEIAMVSSYSAAGYVYPCLKLAAFTSNTLPGRIRFCGSAEEVVKNVVAGSVGLGACEAGVIEEVFRQNGIERERERLVRVILETDPIPTDPVVVRSGWLPRHSPAGRELQDALRTYFASDSQLPRLELSASAKYDDLRRNVEALEAMKR